jgi:hypothetical protein
MTDKKTWFINGAARGVGTDTASVARERPRRRFPAGADATALSEQKLATRQGQIDAFHDLSTSLALNDTTAAVA